jgi:hypothetical protein
VASFRFFNRYYVDLAVLLILGLIVAVFLIYLNRPKP